MVEIKNVDFSYRENSSGSIRQANLNVRAGECILLCGASGCGKTTMTKLINGLIPHFEESGILTGTTIVEKMDIAKTPMYEIAKKVGSVFQNPKSQFFHTDSDSEIIFGMENAGVPRETMKKRFHDTVQHLELEPLLHRSIFPMSGGEKQSLAFASVYAMKPTVFVLDEPTANLDTHAIGVLHDQIAKIKQEGHTIIVAEHRLYFLADLIDRAIFMEDGAIKKIYRREEFLALTDTQRVQMGLRTLRQQLIKISNCDKTGVNSDIMKEKKKEGLRVEKLVYETKGTPIFAACSFQVREGEVLGIIGRNGAGKSTLSRCICGILKESNGQVRINGKRAGRKERSRASFLVMQDVNHQLFADSVWNECKLANANLPDDKIEEVLTKLQLAKWKEHHPMALSGGQKQRLAVATAILSDKKIMIFDEPTSGLDYRNMIAVSEVIKMLSDMRKIILIVTHDIEFLNLTCDSICEIPCERRKDG